MIKSAKNEALYEPYKEQFDALEKSLKISKEVMLKVTKRPSSNCFLKKK